MNDKILSMYKKLNYMKNPNNYLVKGTYTEDECIFLLKDVNSSVLDLSDKEREALKEKGVPYYSMMPKEKAVDKVYNELFLELLSFSSKDIAHQIGVMAESIYAEKKEDTILVSLVRAGTPFGILIKNYIKFKYNIDVPHYSISIIRKKGIDENAIIYILGKHPNAKIQFIDSWTGKGSITQELKKSIDSFNKKYDCNIDSSLAVLADPAKISRICGTREDVIIPNCCLNSTVAGLISRSYVNDSHINGFDFHGAIKYEYLIKDDYSRLFLDKIRDEFKNINPKPSYFNIENYGEYVIKQISKEFNIADEDRIKLSIGEASRMLLRKEPEILLIKNVDNPSLKHVIRMANDKKIKIIQYDKFDYECIAIIK